MEGAEPFRAEGDDVGVLISHGFTGTTQSVRPLARAMARGGFTVSAPRLAGHGTNADDLEKSTAEDWVATLEAEISWLRERTGGIFFVGLSMGGTLALYMAALHPELARGVVTVNASIFLHDQDLARAVFDPRTPKRLPGIGSDIKAVGRKELAYEEVPTAAVKEFMALMRVTDDLLPAVTAPAIVFQSREDHVVPPANGPYIAGRLGGTYNQLIELENSYHVATLDNDAGHIAERTFRFILER